MTRSLRSLDWNTLVFAALGCYLIPALILGTLLWASFEAPQQSSWLTASLLLAYVLAPPAAAGYFTAKFARNRPLLHVALIWLLFVVVMAWQTRGSLGMQLALAAASLALVSLGAFVHLRRRAP